MRNYFFVPLILLFSYLSAQYNYDRDQRHVLYLVHKNEVEQAIDRYFDLVKETGVQNYEILQEMALNLMKKGAKSTNPEIQTLSMYGAGLANNATSLEILETGLHSSNPETQMIALHFIASSPEDRSHILLSEAMSSPFLMMRMEAAYFMAARKHPHAVGHIEALMQRLPPYFKPYFPNFFALAGTTEAISILKQLLEDPQPVVRIGAILSAALFQRDDLLPAIRKKASYAHTAELEAIAVAIGYLKDSNSIPILRKFTQIGSDSLKIAAYKALYSLGDTTVASAAIELAKTNNVYAIEALGYMEEGRDALLKLINSSDLQIRINAAIALLKLRDSRCVPFLYEVFVKDMRDLAFQPISSMGRGATALKIIPSSELRTQDPTVDLSYSAALKEQLLSEAAGLEISAFLTLAEMIFLSQQNALIPSVIGHLEKLQTNGAISLLKKYSQKTGMPFLRGYCNLALYRMGLEGPYEKQLIKWIEGQKHEEIIRLRPVVPNSTSLEKTTFILSPEETSRLLIDAFSAVAARQNEKSIELLLRIIQKGNPLNRYALAGLLIRATE